MTRDLAIFRAVEAVFAIAIVLVLYNVVHSGALSSLGTSFGDWYSEATSGMFDVSVVDTSIKLPNLDRASLPIGSDQGATTVAYTPDAMTPPTETLQHATGA